MTSFFFQDFPGKKTNWQLCIIDKIRNGEISLADVKSNQAKFKSNLGEVKRSQKGRAKKQKDTLYNIEMLYKARGTRLFNVMMIILQ